MMTIWETVTSSGGLEMKQIHSQQTPIPDPKELSHCPQIMLFILHTHQMPVNSSTSEILRLPMVSYK